MKCHHALLIGCCGLAASAVLPVLLWRSTSTSTSMRLLSWLTLGQPMPAVHLCQVRQYFALADCIARDPCAFPWCCGVPELRVAMIQPSFFRGYFKLPGSSSCWAKFEPWPDSYFQPWHFEPRRLSDMYTRSREVKGTHGSSRKRRVLSSANDQPCSCDYLISYVIHPITMKLLRMEHSHSSLLSSSNDVERWRPDCNIGCFSHSKLQVMLQAAIVLSFFSTFAPLFNISSSCFSKPPFAKPNNINLPNSRKVTVHCEQDTWCNRNLPIIWLMSYLTSICTYLYKYVVCNAFGCRLCIWLPRCSTSFHDLQQQVGCVVCFSPIGDNWRTRLRQCLDLGMESVGYSFGVKWSARRGGINKEKMFV